MQCCTECVSVTMDELDGVDVLDEEKKQFECEKYTFSVRIQENGCVY